MQFICNIIPLKRYRKRARNFLFKKLEADYNSVIFVNSVDSHIPKNILAQINAVDNEFFMLKNANIANANIANRGGGKHIKA